MLKPGWIQTYSGLSFWPLDPDPQNIVIEDIAHALSMMCRYSGHCINFYSVAEHCVLIHDWLNEEKKWGLLHDASEAYLVDIPRPIKPSLNNYYTIEEGLMGVIAKRFGLVGSIPSIVKFADNSILADERVQNMKPTEIPDEVWGALEKPLGIKLQYWSPREAEQQFLDRFYR